MVLLKSKLIPLISPERLGPYLKDASGDLHKAFELYEHNQALSEALYIPLQNLEVGLRNRMDGMLSQHFGSRWFDGGVVQKQAQLRALQDAMNKLTRSQKTHDPGRIIAELTFGFWTSFFDGLYDQPLWHHHLREVFPGSMDGQALTRKLFSGRLESIRRMRNRVFHHEPIFRMEKLALVYGDITYILALLSPDLEAWNKENDRFSGLIHG